MPSFDLRPCKLEEVEELCQEHHGYAGAGDVAAYTFGVYEEGRMVAGYAWQAPAFGSAKKACPVAPWAVLSLSRTVAVPKGERRLKHVSKPLMVQMKKLIDRGRWPGLDTHSDRGEGHTGYVYMCSGWQCKGPSKRPTYTLNGVRVSSYANGRHRIPPGAVKGSTILDRWESWVCPPSDALEWTAAHGWCHEPIPGKVWRSGRQAYRVVQRLDSIGKRSAEQPAAE